MSQPTQLAALVQRIRTYFYGPPILVELLLAAFSVRGHVLLEGPPGTAKTMLAWAIARSVGLKFKRVQMTPDLMPSDLLGTSVWLPQQARFEFRPGPLFTDTLLADELNRAPPKTQSALLEAMQERRVTYDGETRELGSSFWVIATQNPLEQEGTYPLPESQVDRFALKLHVDYPSDADELAVLHVHRDRGDPMEQLRTEQPSLGAEQLTALTHEVETVYADDTILDYIQQIVRATRSQPELTWGAGPRAAITLLRCGRGLAAVRGRQYVLPDDIQALSLPTLQHRIRLAPEAQIAGLTARDVLERVVRSVPVPAVRGDAAAPFRT